MNTRLSLPCIAIVVMAFSACHTLEPKKTAETNVDRQTDSGAIRFDMVSTAVAAPLQMDICPDHSHRLFVTDLHGKIWILKNDTILPKPFLDISNLLESKDTTPELKALFSMAFHPQYASNGKFYVCYNAPTTIKSNICKLVVSEFEASKEDPDYADPKTERRVFEMEGHGVEELGSQIAFGPDGYLYISIGDHGDKAYKNRAQDLDCFNGKLLRIDVNKYPYAVPSDNPFVGRKNERPEIYAYGFRRLWRFSFDPKTHQLIGGDVGDVKNEEVDLITKGGNYGWPVREGDSTYGPVLNSNDTAFSSPINTYTHNEGICVIGGDFYYGHSIPSLREKYVFADFNGKVFSLAKDGSNNWERKDVKIINKPADPFLICGCNADENGELYVMGLLNTNNGDKGVIYKVAQP